MQTLEQITRNGIHSADSNGSLWPTMPSLSEQLVAQEFADEINSGRLSVRDAYRNFWSYEEDAELWGLPKDREWRGLLPDWRPILSFLIMLLKDGYANDLIKQVNPVSYGEPEYFDFPLLWCLRGNPYMHYYAFEDNAVFAKQLEGKNQRLRQKIGKEVMDNLLEAREIAPDLIPDYLQRLVDLQHWDERLIELLLDKGHEWGYHVWDTIVRIGHANEKIRNLLDHPNQELQQDAFFALTSWKMYDSRFLRLLKSKRCKFRDSIFEILVNEEIYHPDMLSLLLDKKRENRTLGIDLLSEIKHFDPKMVDMLYSGRPTVRAAALEVLGDIGHYTPRIDELLGDTNSEVRFKATYALSQMQRFNPKMIELLECDYDPGVREIAFAAIIEANEGAEDYIESWLNSENEEYVMSAIEALGNRGVYRGCFRKYLQSDNSTHRKIAGDTLIQLGHFDEVTCLLDDSTNWDHITRELRDKGYYTPKMADMLSSEDKDRIIQGLICLKMLKEYDVRIDGLIDHKDREIANYARAAAIATNHYSPHFIEDITSEDLNGGVPSHLMNLAKEYPEPYSILEDIKMIKRSMPSELEDMIRVLHNRCKPQGYNPPVKKLSA